MVKLGCKGVRQMYSKRVDILNSLCGVEDHMKEAQTLVESQCG